MPITLGDLNVSITLLKRRSISKRLIDSSAPILTFFSMVKPVEYCETDSYVLGCTMVNAKPATKPNTQQNRIIHFLRSNECNRYIRSMRIRFVVSGEK